MGKKNTVTISVKKYNKLKKDRREMKSMYNEANRIVSKEVAASLENKLIPYKSKINKQELMIGLQAEQIKRLKARRWYMPWKWQ